MRRRRSIFENIKILIIIGLMAGALGGMTIGIATRKSSTSASTVH